MYFHKIKNIHFNFLVLLILILTNCAFQKEAGQDAFADLAGTRPEGAQTLYSGAGVFVTRSIILTAKHVVQDCRAIRVASADGSVKAVAAKLRALGFIDMALLDLASPAVLVHPAKFRVLWPSDAEMAALTGESGVDTIDNAGPIIALGYPQPRPTVEPSAQSISILGASRPDRTKGYHIYVIFGALDHGDSGGPLVDQEGSVVGITISRGDPSEVAAAVHDGKAPLEMQHGLALGIAANDLLAFAAKSGVVLPAIASGDAEPPEKRAAASVARVFCYR